MGTCGGGGSHVHMSTLKLDVSERTRSHTRIGIDSRPPAPPPSPSPLPLYRSLLPSQGEPTPWMRRLSTSLRTPHIVPILIHEEHGVNLNGTSAENCHRRGVSPP